MARTDKWIWIILLAYAVGFLSFPPRVLLINDEERYVVQALAFSRGATTVPGARVETRDRPLRIVTDYPPGTSLLQAPLVRFGGWRAAALLSVLSLFVLTFATRALLREFDLPTGFALLIAAYPGNLLFGRTAMSDLPGAAIAACAILMLVRARDRGPFWAFGAGVVTASTLLFREPLAIVVLPFALALFRAAPMRWLPMMLGATAGVALRLVAAHALFGNALHMRDAGYGFSFASIGQNLPLYAVVFLVLLPFGLILPFAYRGTMRWQMVSAVAAYVILILSFEYNPWRDNGVLQGTALASRFAIPITPLLAVMAAEVWPRWTAWMKGRERRWMQLALIAAITTVAVAAFAIHPAIRTADAEPLGLVQTIAAHAPQGATLVVNERSVGKYVSPVYGARRLVSTSIASVATIQADCLASRSVRVVLLDRLDTPMFRNDATASAALLERIASLPLRALHDSLHAPNLRLRIYEVAGCSGTR